MEVDNLDNYDVEYYNKEGEFLNEFYNLKDFLACPETMTILEEEHYNNYEKNTEPILKDFLNYFQMKHIENGTSIFSRCDFGKASGELVAMIYNHLNKQYDLTIFYNNPELAQPLLELEKKEKKEKKEKSTSNN